MAINLDFSHDRIIESAYVITIPGHAVSQTLSRRCVQSCARVGMPSQIWPAFDGTGLGEIIPPDHARGQHHYSWIKTHDNRITKSQIACVLSHFSLWCHCLTIDRPIVILEHDAVMVKALSYFNFFNIIQFLGCREQMQGWDSRSPTPPQGSAFDRKLRFICRAHAYAIDPAMAKNLISRLIQTGVFATSTADIFMRVDLFGVVQDGIYAYDGEHELGSTIEELDL